MPKWRYVTGVALLIYCAGVIFFALSPTDDIKVGEWIAAVFAGIAAVGLIAYMFPGITLPGENYAYLATGFAGFTTLLLYLIDTVDSQQRRAAIAMFLLSGAIAGYGAFLAQDANGNGRLDG